MVDATRGKLHIPTWYSPYLEKHRIYELFHELCRELVIQKPEDHVLFLKEVLYNAAYSRYAPRVVLLAPAHVNRIDVAKGVNRKYKATIITEQDILFKLDRQPIYRPPAQIITQYLREVLRADNAYYTGWIFPDYPRTRKEAKLMLQAGILPSHVFQLIPPFQPSLYDLNVGRGQEEWAHYRRTLIGMRDIFKHRLKEVYIGDRSISEVADECIVHLNNKNRYKAPIIPRVCILGPRGCGRKTQAKIIAKKFNLVCLEFEKLLCQAWISETHLASLLRASKTSVGYTSILLTAVVHKRILEKDCLQRGWVITGFPNTVEDLKNFDQLDTPPNRIIFIESELKTCKDRVVSRKVNAYTGSVINIYGENKLEDIYKTHPKDIGEFVDLELRYYCDNYLALRKYCGRTANCVEGNQPVQWVTDCISAIIMRPLPDAEPRCPMEFSATISEASCDAYDNEPQSRLCEKPAACIC